MGIFTRYEKPVEFTCRRDGLTIRGHIYGKREEPRPAVILCHGFLADDRSVRSYARLLAGLGYVAFTFDFCGGGIHSKSDGKKSDMTVLTEVEDLLTVIDRVRKRPYVISDRVSLLGCSQGGFVSAMTAAAGGIEKLVLFYPALCIPDDARSGQMMFYKFDPDNIPDILGTKPMPLGGNYARAVINMDPYAEIKGYKGPTLIVHGTKDKIVNVDYARKAKFFYSDCIYREIEGGTHGFRGRAEKEARKALADFMRLD